MHVPIIATFDWHRTRTVRHAPSLEHTDSETALKDNVRRLLQEISEELCQAIGESSELSKKLHDLEQEGYLLNLILDCRQADTDESSADEPSLGRQRIRTEDSSVAPTPSSTEANPVSEHLAAAEFRIDAQDLAFLRSVGIDPTRPGRSKRRRRAETTSSANGS